MTSTKAKSAIVIGAGFSGLSAATSLADLGYKVTLLEKHEQTGGRARVFKKQGFTFDMGPSWYWMPDVMESYFNSFGKSTADYFELIRLNPSYQVIFSENKTMQIPANYQELKAVFESYETGSGRQLDLFLDEAQKKYTTAMGKFVQKPSKSFTEFVNLDIVKSAIEMQLLTPFSKHVRKFFQSKELLQLMEFPVLFLGALPKNIPAMYSLMNYADIKLGTWYPNGGFGKLAEAMTTLAIEKGVDIQCGQNVLSLEVENKKITKVVTDTKTLTADVVVSSADYHFTEQKLLPKNNRKYKASYWDKRVMAPSCLLYYIGVNKKVKKLLHHNLFFEDNFDSHAKTIYENPQWPEKPLYYVCCPSKTDASVAPEGMENLFLLIPVAPGLQDTPQIRKKYFQETITRLEAYCGENISNHIVSYTDYAQSDFISDYNAFKGNAYGLANTLKQTAFLKPSIINPKVKNLFYTGQLTVPGPGVPPSIISGQMIAKYIVKHH
jgi:phytoene desaturase